MSKKYIFNKENKHEKTSSEDIEVWKKKKEELREELNDRFSNKLLNPNPSKFKGFEVTIDNPRGGTMPAYWALIGTVKDWYFEQGVIYTKEMIDQMFKILAGHTEIINGVEVTKSIAYNSDCTWQDMKKLLDYVVAFGIEENIMGLEIKERDKEAIKKGYDNANRKKL